MSLQELDFSRMEICNEHVMFFDPTITGNVLDADVMLRISGLSYAKQFNPCHFSNLQALGRRTSGQAPHGGRNNPTGGRMYICILDILFEMPTIRRKKKPVIQLFDACSDKHAEGPQQKARRIDM